MSTEQKVRLLRAEGYSYRTIADKIGISVGAVERQLQKPSTVFKLRERDPDFLRAEKALEMGATLHEAWIDYAETAAKPYSFSHFGARVAEWEKVGKPSSDNHSLSPKLHDPTSREPSLGSGTDGQRSHPGKEDRRPPQSLVAPSRSFAAMSPPSILWIDTPGTALQVRMKSLAVRFGDGPERHFPRGKHSLRTIILHAPGASVTIEAARWAVDEGVTVLIMHRAGEALAFLTNHPLADSSGPALELRRAQFSADPVKVARAVVRAKIDASRTEGVLSDEDARFGARKLLKAETVDEILLIEAATAGIYWRHWDGFQLSFSGKAPPAWKRYGTRTRKVSDGMTSARNAVDPGNAILNYAYAVVLGNVTRALIGFGLDPAFGFLHADKSGRLSLSYDVIEVLRPKIDRYMFQWIASRTFERKEFIELPSGPILLTPGLAKQVALRILEKVSRRDCEQAVEWLASTIKISGGALTLRG